MIDEHAVYTVDEAARLIRISPRTYYAGVSRNELPAFRIGRRLVVPGSALLRVLDTAATSFPLEARETAAYLFEERR